jgi:hypothetical protein
MTESIHHRRYLIASERYDKAQSRGFSCDVLTPLYEAESLAYRVWQDEKIDLEKQAKRKLA